jgi:MFS family permease
MAFVHYPYPYLAFSAILGVGTAFLWPATYAISADIYPVEQRGRVIGYLNLNQMLGFGTGAVFGALLVERLPEIVFAAGFLALTAGLLTALSFVPNHQGGKLFARVAHTVARPSVLQVMTARIFFICVLILSATVGLSMQIPAIRPFGDEQLQVSFAVLTLTLVPAIVAGAATYIPAGRLADRFGRWRPFLAGQLLCVCGLLLLASTTHLVVASLATVIIFVGNVSSVPAWNAAIMDAAPFSHRGTLIGLSVALTGLGLAIGPAAGGLAVETLGAVATFRIGAAIFAANAAAIFLYVWVLRRAGPLVEEAAPAQ